MAHCEELIHTSRQKGKGTEDSPNRTVVSIFRKDGKLIAESDPNGNFTIEDMYDFAKKLLEEKCSVEEWLNSRLFKAS